MANLTQARGFAIAPALATLLFVGVSQSSADDRAEKSDVTCRRDTDGYCASGRVLVDIGGAYDSKTVPLNVALGDVVTITWKRPLKIKTCKATPKQGQDQSAETYCGAAIGNAALLSYTVNDELIKLAAHVPQGFTIPEGQSATEALWEEHGNLQLVMKTGQQLTFEVRVRPPAQSVNKVLINSPTMTKEHAEFAKRCSDHLGEQTQRLRGQWADIGATANLLARDAMTADVNLGHRCRTGSWTNMSDLLWVRAVSVCLIGRRLYLTATIENRSKQTPFEVDKLVLLPDGKDADDTTALGVDGSSYAFHRRELTPEGSQLKEVAITDIRLHYGQRVRASIGVDLSARVPKKLALQVHELDGGKRVVRVGGITF